jgi:hypothetical protein
MGVDVLVAVGVDVLVAVGDDVRVIVADGVGVMGVSLGKAVAVGGEVGICVAV